MSIRLKIEFPYLAALIDKGDGLITIVALTAQRPHERREAALRRRSLLQLLVMPTTPMIQRDQRSPYRRTHCRRPTLCRPSLRKDTLAVRLY
jgi:hypothetical protein